MGLMSTFFLSGRDGIEELEGEMLRRFPRVDTRSVTNLDAAGIYCALLGEGDPLGLLDDFQLLSPEESQGPWIFTIPEGMSVRLSELAPEAVTKLAEDCARITSQELAWSAEDFVSLLTGLTALARQGREEGQQMFLHVCL